MALVIAQGYIVIGQIDAARYGKVTSLVHAVAIMVFVVPFVYAAHAWVVTGIAKID